MRITRLAATFGALTMRWRLPPAAETTIPAAVAAAPARGIVGKASSSKKLTIGVSRPARPGSADGSTYTASTSRSARSWPRVSASRRAASPGRPRSPATVSRTSSRARSTSWSPPTRSTTNAEGRQLRRSVLRRRPGPAGAGRLDDHRPGGPEGQEGLLGERLDPGQADQVRLQGRAAPGVRLVLQVRDGAGRKQVDAGHHRRHHPGPVTRPRRSTPASSRSSAKPFSEEPYGIGVKKTTPRAATRSTTFSRRPPPRVVQEAWDDTLGKSGKAAPELDVTKLTNYS